MASTLTLQEQVKEAAVHDHRHWVRIAAGCNNRCTFCLDSDMQDGRVVPHEDILREIHRGRDELHATRLILSGGEASINARFPEYIRLGKELGYRKVQTVTNGRMYSYPKFCEKVLSAGLDEVTFSLHGHTPELHDTLVGIKGAFVQLIKGMTNLMGRCIVNVDVVLNKQNYKHVHDIVELCMRLGVHEFDLLHITPFGRAYPANKDFLMYNVDAALPYLRKVFALAEQGKIFVWTNRFPVRHLEGFERLIQDPHKLFDEINGRRFMFQDYLENNQLMPCHGERCQYCFLDKYCQNLIREKNRLDEKQDVHLCLDAAQATAQLDRVAVFSPAVVLWRAQTAAELLAVNTPPEWQDTPVWVSLRQGRGLLNALAQQPRWRVARVKVFDEEGLSEALTLPDVVVEIALNRELQAHLLENAEALAPHGSRLEISLESFESLGETDEQGADAEAFYAAAPDWLRAVPSALPACFSGAPTPMAEKVNKVDAALVKPDGTMDIDAVTLDFILEGYRARSLRCEKCVHAENCEGLQIQYLRRHGFKQLRPVMA